MNVSKADMEWYVRQPGVLFKAITSPAFSGVSKMPSVKIISKLQYVDALKFMFSKFYIFLLRLAHSWRIAGA